MTDNFTFVYWCSGCNAEQAVDEMEIQIDGKWHTINIGQECLTRLAKESKIKL